MKSLRKLVILCMAAAVLPMMACGSSMPELTEEQNEQIVEYAAGLLLKYDANYHDRIVEIKEEAAEEVKVQEEPIEKPVEEPVEEPAEDMAEVIDNTGSSDAASGIDAFAERSMEDFYGIEGVTISHTGYEVKDRYPDANAEGEDLFFAMTASAGSKLLIFNFNVANVSGQDVNFDMASLGTKFKISINGGSPRYILTTMLLNDLSSYKGTIPAGAAENLVLVSEIPEEDAGSIQSIALLMKNNTEDARLSLN